VEVYTVVSKNSEYLWKKNEVFYFRRHVPVDEQRHYERSSIVICLKTKNKPSALKASRSISSKLDDFWLQLRISELDVPASHLLVKGKPKEAFSSYAPKLSEALGQYCSLKGQERYKGNPRQT
jgi:hypothetical protein